MSSSNKGGTGLKRIIKIIIIVAIVVSLPGNLCSGSGTGSSSAKKERAKLTAQLLVQKLREKAKTHSIPDEFLYQEMKGNPEGQYTDPAESWQLLREKSKEYVRNWYQNTIDDILNRLDSNTPENVDSWFSQEEKREMKQCSSAVLEKNLDNNFGESYNQNNTDSPFYRARKKVCNEQWHQRVQSKAYPEESEFENTSRTELKQRILQKLIESQPEHFFEENKDLLSENIADPILEDTKRQLEKQKEIVEKSEGGGKNVVFPPQIEQLIKEEIDSYQEKLKKQKEEAEEKVAAKVYDVFPSVKKMIPEKTRELAVERFADQLSEANFIIPKEKIKSMIENNLSAHQKAKESKQIIVDTLRSLIKTKAVTEYSRMVSKDKRSEFRSILETFLNQNQKCRAALEDLAERSIENRFQEVRKEISEEQFSTFFVPLKEKTWGPTYEEIEDYPPGLDHVEDYLSQEGISNRTFSERNLLEETKTKISQAVDALAKRGQKALYWQNQIVDNLKTILKQSIEVEDTLPTLDSFVEEFAEMVKNRWETDRIPRIWGDVESAPPNKDTKYVELFPSVKEKIKDLAKSILYQETERREEIKREKERQKRLEEERRRREAERERREAERQKRLEEERKKRLEEEKKRQEELKEQQKKSEKEPGGTPGEKGEEEGGEGSSHSENMENGGKSGKGGPGGESSGGNKEPPKPKEPEPDLIIDLDYLKDGDVNVNFIFKEESDNPAQFVMSPGVYNKPDSLKRFSSTITSLFKKWLAEKSNLETREDGSVSVYVVVRIFDGRVDYGIVYALRSALRKAVKQFENVELIVRWYDYQPEEDKKENKNKFKVIPDFKKRSSKIA